VRICGYNPHMGNTAIIWTLAGIIAAPCFARGLKMRDDSRPLAELLWYSAGAFFLAGASLLWVSLEPEIMNQHRIILGVVGAIFGSIGLMALGEWIHPATPAKAQTAQQTPSGSQPSVSISGGDNVVSIGQMGGITARVVTINPPLNPELRILGKTETDNPDGSHTVTLKTEVASPITPGLLVIKIDAVGIRNVSVTPAPVNGVSTIEMRNVSRTQNSFSAEIPAPRGQYYVSINTSSSTPISLNASF
jgi:hypothetical protein